MFLLYAAFPGVSRRKRLPTTPLPEKRVPVLAYSVAAGSLVLARAGNSNSTLPSSFKTSRARKGLPALERKPDRTSFVLSSSRRCLATSGVRVRRATLFQIANPHTVY